MAEQLKMDLKLRGFFVYLYDETQDSSDADKIFVTVWKKVNKWIPLYCCSTQHNIPIRGSSNDVVRVLAKENEVGGVGELQMDILTRRSFQVFFKHIERLNIREENIDLEFKSFLLDKMMGLFFINAAEKMIEAFEARALELYKTTE